jgi:YVTN family beta-propeller protein
MQRKALGLVLCVLTVWVCGVVAQEGAYFSPTAIAVDQAQGLLYITGSTAGKIAVVNAKSPAVAREIALPGNPNGIVLSKDGKTLFVAGGGMNIGFVAIVDAASGSVTANIPAGHTPMAPVLSPDEKTLYVCYRFDNEIAVIDIAGQKETTRIPALREPIAAGITPDGKTLVVANHLPTQPSNSGYVASTVQLIDTATNKVVKDIVLPDGTNSVRGLSVSADGKYAFAAHVLARYQLPTTQLERGWMNTNAVSIIDLAKQELLNAVLLDNVDRGAANPWAVQSSADGKFLCVTQAGTHEVSVIDFVALLERLAKAEANERVTEVTRSKADVRNDLAFLVGIRDRVKLPGNSPRGLAIVDDKVYVSEFYTDSLAHFNLGVGVFHNVQSLPLTANREMSDLRKGEMFFNDAALCFQEWQSCASCHPDDRVDGLSWDLLNDGIGNPKNTKSMFMTFQTPPVMVSGIRGEAKIAVRAGIRFIQFAVRPEEDVVKIDKYLEQLKAVPSPYLVKGELSEAAKRGQMVFEKAECNLCHPAPLYTNLKSYNVGTGIGREETMEFDTPTLVEVWRTAPYLYDGRTTDMKEVLTKHNKDDKHGKTSKLSEQEINDLVEYVLSL